MYLVWASFSKCDKTELNMNLHIKILCLIRTLSKHAHAIYKYYLQLQKNDNFQVKFRIDFSLNISYNIGYTTVRPFYRVSTMCAVHKNKKKKVYSLTSQFTK